VHLVVEKEKLGVDLDETVVWLLPDFINYYNGEHGTSFDQEDFHCYRWWEVLDISRESLC
jgi:5'(3')-deoxyribonucleotidase